MRAKKMLGLAAAATMLVVVLAACKPTFPTGSTLTVTGNGPLATLSWPNATSDTDKTIVSYRVDIEGTQVALLPSTQLSCVLVGAPAGVTSNIRVTAYDSVGGWSGDDTLGIPALLGTYTPPASASPGTPNCVLPTDTDGDRLPDAVETNTGTYLNSGATGTNPGATDRDNDGLKDGDEVLGTTGGVDFPAMGASPTKKDIAFEFDWFDDNAEPSSCAAHSHRPTAGAINKLTTAFGTSPATNPDGTTGVHVIADYGQGGAFTGGNLVADADGVLAGGVNGVDYTAVKNANFAANRAGLFHYVENVHRYNTNGSSSGQAEINGNDLIVSLYCFASSAYYSGSDQYVANTIVHEVGHNLGLRHGGNVDTNYKPNYNSVMNYQFQFPGIDNNCDRNGDNVLSYSIGARATLNEAALVEANGICSSVPIDWSGNSIIDAGTVVKDINQDGLSNGVLADHNDWANLNLAGVNLVPGASPLGHDHTDVITEQPVPAKD